MSVSTLKWVAPTAWLINVAAQIYGMSSTPSMLDVHEANKSFFSPQPYFIAGFFTPQQFVQAAYLYKLVFTKPTTAEKSAELSILADYAPIYSLGNICIAVWMLLWNSSNLVGSDIAVWINSLSQIAYTVGAIGNLGPLNTRSWASILTHLNVKTFAGIGVLDALHNTSIAFAKDQRAGMLTKVLTGLGFGAASLASDWIFGGCLVYDLVALSIGQSQYDPGWGKLLGGYAAGSAAIVVLKNWFRSPYVSQPVDYQGLAYGGSDSLA